MDGTQLRHNPIAHPERPFVKIYDKDRGYLGSKDHVWVGDQVVITNNQFVGPPRDRTYVTNGTIGTVSHIHEDGTIQIALANKNIKVNPESFKHLRLAYAVSSYKAQGNTFDSVLALLGEHTSDLPDFYVHGRRAFVQMCETLSVDSIDVEVMAWNAKGKQFWQDLGFTHRYEGLRWTSQS